MNYVIGGQGLIKTYCCVNASDGLYHICHYLFWLELRFNDYSSQKQDGTTGRRLFLLEAKTWPSIFYFFQTVHLTLKADDSNEVWNAVGITDYFLFSTLTSGCRVVG